ncbi:MAG: glycosyl transferase, partial [Clostridiales bacterium]|nr:glycosyl transferase [Clostridiales bacterium]
VIKDQGSYRRFTEPNPVLPKAHILSNGNYTVLVTDKGNGYSRTKSDAVTRWRKDASYGMFFYFKNVETGAKWSSTYAPLGVKPDFYEVVFTPDKALFKRKDGLVETSTEIIVASGDNVEIRRIKLKNSGKSEVQLELTSYYELVLAPHKSDLAHPTFSNLFIETEFDAKYNALIANRRPRDSKEKGLWVAQMPVAEDPSTERIRYETDRMLFLGRGRTVANPVMVERDKQMANTTGTVLDPILSIQMRVRIQAEQSTRISFVTMIADSKEELYVLLEKYSNIETCDASFWLAVSRSQVETRYLNIKAAEMELYQNMISDIVFLSPIRKNYASSIALNKKGQSSLWPYGISGDHPIILIVIDKAESVDVLNEALKAHEYWRLKDLRVDLVIVVKEENSYFNPLATLVNEIVFSGHTTDGIRLSNDIFVLNEKNLAENDFYLLSAVSSLIFKGNGMSMFEQWTTEEPVNMATLRSKVFQRRMDEPAYIRKTVVSDNGIGGFSDEGNSYLIQLENEQVTPAPWTNVIANQEFGFIVTESGGGFTWSGNSRENKLTPWSNDPVSDVPGEVFYLSDASLEVWSMTPQPVRETSPYTIEHGFGYTSFGHVSHGLSQKMTQFVPVKGNVKISLISIENLTPEPKAITLTHYVKPVMGVQPSDTGMHIRTSLGENGALLIENPFNQTYAGEVMYMNTSIAEKTVTGSKTDFFGSTDIRCPEALKNTSLSGTVGIGYVPCAAMQIEKTIQPGETAVLTFVIGTASNIADATRDSLAFADVESAKSALDEVKSFWNNKLSSVQIRTPNRAFDIMMNGWLMYQVISCRLWARSAFYQSGGAFGFRDQLQDSLSIMNIWPELAREQIAKHAAHQFVEGDVLHWWHEPELKGTRTRISDDYLWLPFVTAIYIDRTQDEGFLDLVAPFLEAEILEPHEDERYCSPRISEESGSI